MSKTTYTLTGKTRHRVQRHWGKNLLVLQVEENGKGYYLDHGGGRIDTVDFDNTYWRDAKVEDLKEL